MCIEIPVSQDDSAGSVQALCAGRFRIERPNCINKFLLSTREIAFGLVTHLIPYRFLIVSIFGPIESISMRRIRSTNQAV